MTGTFGTSGIRRTGPSRFLGGRILGALAAVSLLALPACDAFTPPTPEEQFTEAITADPAFVEMYEIMEAEFPRDFARFKRDMMAVIESSDDPATGFAAGRDFMLNFTAANAEHFRAAPTAALLEARDANIALVEALAEQDPALCANYGMRGLQFGDEPTGDAKMQLGRVTAMQLSTIAAGQNDPAAREEPTQADIDALLVALQERGMTEAETQGFLMGTLAMQGLGVERECDLGVAVYNALADIPDEGSARLSAILLLPTAQ